MKNMSVDPDVLLDWSASARIQENPDSRRQIVASIPSAWLAFYPNRFAAAYDIFPQ
jgi:hypothetical protein